MFFLILDTTRRNSNALKKQNRGNSFQGFYEPASCINPKENTSTIKYILIFAAYHYKKFIASNRSNVCVIPNRQQYSCIDCYLRGLICLYRIHCSISWYFLFLKYC